MAYARFVDPAQSPLTEAIRALRRQNDRDRPKGLHISTICDDYHRTLYPAKYRGMSEATSAGFQEIGNAFEDLLGTIQQQRFRHWTKPAPRTVQGVILSPDGVNTATETIEETKACWASSASFLTIDAHGQIIDRSVKFRSYEIRIMAYLKAWHYLRARLHVWFVCGNWRPPIPEWPRTIVLRYTQHEIDEMWRRLMVHARDRKMLK